MTLLFFPVCYQAESSEDYSLPAFRDATANAALDCAFIVFTIGQLLLATLIVSRRFAPRPAFIALLFALGAMMLSHIVDVASVVTCSAGLSVAASPQSAAQRVREANHLDQVQDFFRDLADLLSIASAFLILHSRRAVLRPPETKSGWLKPTLDIFLAASVLVTSMLAHFTQVILFWLDMISYCIVLLDLAVTAFRLRAQAHDQVTDSVACLLVPLWIVDIIFRCLGDRGGWVETLGEKCMVPALTFTIFLSLGNSRSVWKSGE